ncbi:deoxyribodipyrimidine photo-lyase [Caldisericum exile]|uniref:deoxyribodipyrimidine photo-lyase n=1 Tax=Caldisericum exile TaxID=693075 RepID=UPI003C76ED67
MFRERTKKLNNMMENTNGNYVVYCMEASQREDFNHALEFSIHKANTLKKPVIVAFFITDKYKFSNQRYYRFMIEGILKTKEKIENRGIRFLILKDDFVNGCLKLSKNACLLVLDKNYLKTQRIWREKVSKFSNVAVYEVESDVVVPIEYLFSKSVPFAYIYRNALEKVLDRFLLEVKPLEPTIKSNNLDLNLENQMNFNTVEDFIKNLNIDKSVNSVENYYKGGSDEAEKLLKIFIEKKLPFYKEKRSDPTVDYTSKLSPYLHFGQISPLKVVLEILKNYDREDENVKAFINELVVWRELSRNFTWYNPFYNQYEGIPSWAKDTLEKHASDKRDYIYTLEEVEDAKTHDEYWNAAQKELLITGKIHNYMRMYWAKKLIEWTDHPKKAFDIACYLNDKYALDGRDPNGYGGISWCFGSFDRPWQERKIFGKIRYMSSRSLETKFNMKLYIEKFKKS